MSKQAEIKTSSSHQISSDAEKFYSDFWVESDATNQQSLAHRKHILNRFFPQGLVDKCVLEVGVGGEGGLIFLLKDSNQVYGHDVSDAAINNCIRFGLDVSKVNMDRDCLRFGDSSFDVIFALEVFEHFSNPQHALEELRRVLKPGGVLLISTPAAIAYHWPRLFYPSLFEPHAFGEFLMVNGFAVTRHENALRTSLKPVPEHERSWGWYWESHKPADNDLATYLALGDYFWNQKNEYGLRRFPIEAIDFYRQCHTIDPANAAVRLKLTHALLYRWINGDPEFNSRFEEIRLNSEVFGGEESAQSYKAVCEILQEAEKLGFPMVKGEDLALLQEVAAQMGARG